MAAIDRLAAMKHDDVTRRWQQARDPLFALRERNFMLVY